VKIELRKQLTRAELKAALRATPGLVVRVVRKIRRPDKADSTGPNALAVPDGMSGVKTYNTSEGLSNATGGVGPLDRGKATYERGGR